MAELDARARAELREFLELLRVEAGLARSTAPGLRPRPRAVRTLAVRARAAQLGRGRRDLLVDWLSERRAQGLSEASLARNLVSVRMLMRFLVREGRSGAIRRHSCARHS
jgi:site-specific recombinase XerC